MVIGPGVRLTDGRGLVTSRGVGRLITTAAGSTTTTIGPGVRTVSTIAIVAGGVPRLSRSISLLGITSHGIHSLIIIGIPAPVITARRID